MRLRGGIAVTVILAATLADARANVVGELSLDHARVGCDGCHVAGSVRVTTGRCVACHDIARAGLHASPPVAKRTCDACHSEHRGRDFDLRGWDELARVQTGAVTPGRHAELDFDHGLSGWELGRHGRLACERCHTSRDRQGLATYRGLTSQCTSCHPHAHLDKFRPDQCLTCHRKQPETPPDLRLMAAHGPSGWLLVGGHRDVACAICHPRRDDRGGTVFERIDTRCSSCHADLLHAGSLGPRCERCHVPATWKPDAFDHTLVFPLRGPHSELACAACHAGRDFASARAACDSCHREPGPTCGACHARPPPTDDARGIRRRPSRAWWNW